MDKNRPLPQVAKPKCAVIGRGENGKGQPKRAFMNFLLN